MGAPDRLYDRLVRERYGTYRGFIRLQLANAEWALGSLSRFRRVDLARVERLVFVCLGNVCRSPYAELVCREQGVECASFGLATETGLPAYGDAVETARSLGRDLAAHRATDLDDFVVRDSDLLLVMEVRQARALADRIGRSKAQIAFLGAWSRPRRVHIHDPMTLSMGYFRTCYRVIESAVGRLARELRERRPAPSAPAQHAGEHAAEIGEERAGIAQAEDVVAGRRPKETGDEA